jgi:lantibiotic leader peptide-processing serine protease
MSRILPRVLSVVVLLLSVNAYAGGRYVVSFTGNLPADFGTAVVDLGGTVEYLNSDGYAVVSGLTDEKAALLASRSGVSELLPDIDIDVRLGTPTYEEQAETFASTLSAASPSTAAFFARQWHLRAIGADMAWAAGRTGSSDVRVAVLDTGIDYAHADLAGRVDLSTSVSFVPSDDAIVAAFFPGKHPVTDLRYHGTHVAATISSNALAAAGVTSRTTLFGVKVLAYTGSGSLSAILDGVYWAADHQADVINMSLGGAFTKAGNGRYVGFINKAFAYAHRKGTLVVVAAGNESADLDHDGNSLKTFCAAPNVVCVSATGPTATAGTNGPWANVDGFASYSNYGRSSISVAAPGGTGAGFVWEACSGTSVVLPVCRTGTFVVGVTGTSMASPHVAGLAALLVSEMGHGKPSQIKARLQQSADDLGQPGNDPLYGQGRINVPRALGLQ